MWNIRKYREVKEDSLSILTVSSSTEQDDTDTGCRDFLDRKFGRGKPFKSSWFDSVQMEEVEKLPEDIDGLCRFKVKCDLGTYSDSTDDRRWFLMQTSNKRGSDRIIIKNGRCQGSFMCQNQNCPFLEISGSANETNFTILGHEDRRCFTCGVPASRRLCDAFKRTEFYLDKNFALVYHIGTHTCHLALPRKKKVKKLLRAMRARGLATNAPPKEVAVDEIINKIQQEDVSGIEEIAEMYSDLKDVSKAQKKLREENTVIQDSNSLDVLIAVKKKTDKMDKYLIHTHYITGTTFVRL